MWQVVIFTSLLLMSSAPLSADQVVLTTDSSVLRLSDKWTVEQPSTEGISWHVIYHRAERTIRMKSVSAENPHLSLSVSLYEVQDSGGVPLSFVADRVIEDFCTLPWLAENILHGALAPGSPAPAPNLSIQIKNMPSVVKGSTQLEVLHISVSWGAEKAGTVEFESRWLIAEVKGKLIMLECKRAGEWDSQVEQEWSRVVEQFELKSSHL